MEHRFLECVNKDAVLVPEVYREQMPENKAKTQGSVFNFFCETRYQRWAGSDWEDPVAVIWAMKEKMTMSRFPYVIRPQVLFLNDEPINDFIPTFEFCLVIGYNQELVTPVFPWQ